MGDAHLGPKGTRPTILGTYFTALFLWVASPDALSGLSVERKATERSPAPAISGASDVEPQAAAAAHGTETRNPLDVESDADAFSVKEALNAEVGSGPEEAPGNSQRINLANDNPIADQTGQALDWETNELTVTADIETSVSNDAPVGNDAPVEGPAGQELDWESNERLSTDGDEPPVADATSFEPIKEVKEADPATASAGSSNELDWESNDIDLTGTTPSVNPETAQKTGATVAAETEPTSSDHTVAPEEAEAPTLTNAPMADLITEDGNTTGGGMLGPQPVDDNNEQLVTTPTDSGALKSDEVVSTENGFIETAKEVLKSNAAAATVIIMDEEATDTADDENDASRPLLLTSPEMRTMLEAAEDSLFTTKWRTIQGGERADMISRAVTRMHDFTTITAGQTKSFSSGRNDAWIVAIDADGTHLWEQKIGGARDDEAKDIVLLDDGGVIVVGGSESVENEGINGPVGFITRISPEGDLLWTHFIKQSDPHTLSAQTLLDNEEGVAFGVSDGTVQMYRFSLNGKRVTKQPVSDCALDSISAAAITASGDIVIAGEHADFLDLIGSMCRISVDGSTYWQTFAEAQAPSTITDIAAIGDDVLGVGFHLAENGNEQALAIRFDPQGQKSWEKSLGAHASERLLALNILSDNRILVLGSIMDPKTLTSRHWIVALSESGEVVESQIGDAQEELTLTDLAPRSDGRYVVVGRKTDEFSREVNGYIALMGTQNLATGETISVSEAAVAPNILVPGDGTIISEKPSTEILGNVIHNRPVARVFVDGQATRLLQNGAFRAFVSTPMGRTTVTIAAIDDLGHVGEAKVDVIRRESVEQTGDDLDEVVATTNFGSYHAILIGNQAYSNGIDTLDTPYKDIEVLGELLREKYRFTVTELKDATRKDTLDAFSRAVDSLGRNDNLLIYYAGHGHYDKDYDQGYWLPIDATIDDRTTWLESGAVKDMIKRMEAKHVLLVADSCFSGTLLRSVDNQRSSKFYEIIASRTARLAMTSGNIEPVMDGGGDGHSVFARQFISTLQRDRPIIDGTYLYNSVREPVVTQSGQMPQYSNIRFLESDGGDFLFVQRP